MTSLTINTPNTSVNTVLSISTTSSFDKKISSKKNYTTYSMISKNWYRKSSPKFTSMDWDLNMNELEFE